MPRDLNTLCVDAASTIRDAVACIEANHLGIALVVDGDRRLVGTITDGDVRRGLLAGIDLEAPLRVLLDRKRDSALPYPVTAPLDADRSLLLKLLQQHGVAHLPLVDEDRRVVGLVTRNDFLPDQTLSLQALIMAGGKGTRLRPLTEETPKPMLPLGGRPLMEIMIEQLRSAGVRRVNVSTHHNRNKFSRYFGDGRDFGVEISYVEEDQPLGTAGALRLMEPRRDTLLVINGDILTQVDFRAMLAYHREHSADLTVAVRRNTFEVSYGVVESDGPRVQRVTEKPVLEFFVNAGIYLIEPAAYDFVPSSLQFDMTDLIRRLVDGGRVVVSFPIHEYWLDIGRHADYQRAQKDIDAWRSGE